MPASNELRFRAACPGDAHAIAGLHADSWQRHYRGAYSDAFLDTAAAGYLRPLWTERLAIPRPQARTILAERDGVVVALAHTLLGEDAAWGAFIDNLHVAHGLKRQGIGTRLLALTAQAVLDWSPSSGLYLWVLEQNSDARAFYAARGGACVERDDVPPPGGDAARLDGKPMGLRYVWRDPSKLPLPVHVPGAVRRARVVGPADASADDLDVFRLGALLALGDVELDLLPFLQAAVAAAGDRAEVQDPSGPPSTAMKP